MDSSMYAEMAELEKSHWWFRGRRAVVFDVLSRLKKQGTLLDIGLGTGFNARLFQKMGFTVHGLDPAPEAIHFAKTVAPGISVIQAPFPSDEVQSGIYDVVTMLDVLEHLDDDEAALRDVARVLKPGGTLLLTVPAFRFMWTKHDERAHHKRRYTRKDLVRVIRAAGLKPSFVSYYNFFLFPPIAVVRLIGKLRGEKEESDFDKSPALLNSLFAFIFGAERYLLRFTRLPFGVSLIAIVRKS